MQAAPGVLANDTDAEQQPADRGPQRQRHARHPGAQRQRWLHLHPDHRLQRSRQLHLPRQRRHRRLEHRDRVADCHARPHPCAAGGSSRTTSIDSSTYANNGTRVGSPTYVAGQVGQAISLNGTSQYVTVPDNNSLDLTTGMTAGGLDPTAGRVLHTQDVIKKADTTGTPSMATSSSLSVSRQGLRAPEPGHLRRHVRINSTDYPLNNTAWMHVAATYDGTTIRLYINGVQEGVESPAPAAIGTNSLPLALGAQSDNSRRFTRPARRRPRLRDRPLRLARSRPSRPCPAPRTPRRSTARPTAPPASAPRRRSASAYPIRTPTR